MATVNLYRTLTMLGAIRQMKPKHTFLRDTYFPHNEVRDQFPTEEVLVEYKKGSNRLAPVVIPRHGGITVERDGYTTARMTPPLVAPQRTLTIDDLNKKGFGEGLFSDRAPAARQAQILGDDLRDLINMIDAREEEIAAQCMLNNGYTLKQYADKYGSGDYTEFEMRFYQETSNPTRYTTSVAWDDPAADIVGDLSAMARLLTQEGLAASDFIVSPDVADAMLRNDFIYKMLDNRRIALGDIAPRVLPNGTTRIGVLNVNGRAIDLISYDAQYENESGAMVAMIPSGFGVLTAPAAGRTVYGCVTQLESDGEFHSYSNSRVPLYIPNYLNNTRQLRVSARPMLIPNQENPFISINVFDV